MSPEEVREQLTANWDAAVELSLYGKFDPFEGQRKLWRALFRTGCKVLFLQCGRGWAKTYSGVWLAAEAALRNSDWYVLYLAPQYKQAKKIVWYPKLFEKFINEAFIFRKDKQETYYELINGTRIEIDGSDNFDSQRGLKPNLVIADEYREFDAEWIDVMFPNILKSSGTIFFMGTPPHFPKNKDGSDHHYVTWANYCKKGMVMDPKRYFFMRAPTIDNPYIDSLALEAERKRLLDQGMEHVWKREYEAEVVSGALNQVFKMISSERHNEEHEVLVEFIKTNPSRYEFGVLADPGTKSVFAVLFIAIDRYNSIPYCLDEIYESDTSLCTTRSIMPEILLRMKDINPSFRDWVLAADSAAAWFIAEARDWMESEEAKVWFEENDVEQAELFFEPTEKRVGDKEEGIALIKDILLTKEKFISDRCEKFFLELVNYHLDRTGRIVKDGDHLIDCFRYGLKRFLFSFVDEKEELKVEKDSPQGWSSVTEQYREWRKNNDWSTGIF